MHFKPVLFIGVIALMVSCSQEGQWLTRSWFPGGARQLPLIVAHRAGTADFPENTQLAIREAIENGADMLWLTVQLSKDGTPVLYRPADLSAQTQGMGPVAAKTVHELQQLNAGWNFQNTAADGSLAYPYRTQSVPIPTLREALRAIPVNMPVILDMKALAPQLQAQAVAQVLEQENAWSQVLLYSTERAYQEAFQSYPQARVFESRDATRGKLIEQALTRQCSMAQEAATWVGFEYRRTLDIVEKFTLGEGRTQVNAVLWTPESIACFRSKGQVNVVAFGVNTAEDYRAAARLGVDAVLSDSPRRMSAVKKGLEWSASPKD